jgi:hypothetical protein
MTQGYALGGIALVCIWICDASAAKGVKEVNVLLNKILHLICSYFFPFKGA